MPAVLFYFHSAGGFSMAELPVKDICLSVRRAIVRMSDFFGTSSVRKSIQEESGMSDRHLRLFKTSCLVLILGVSMSAYATTSTFTWKEEVLLHDGGKIIVTRTVERGGRHEIGQKPSYKEQSLIFTIPGTNQQVIWEDKFSEDLGSANFLPMVLEISGGSPYIVAYPMGCLSYNKWGRPNPPYAFFKYDDKVWQRIPLQELPVEIKTPNLIFSSPDLAVEKFGTRFISSEMIKQLIDGYKQPEYKTILREPVKLGLLGSSVNCEEMIHYKCGWISPHGTFGRNFMDKTCK
jgi:hypothetical protein